MDSLYRRPKQKTAKFSPLLRITTTVSIQSLKLKSFGGRTLVTDSEELCRVRHNSMSLSLLATPFDFDIFSSDFTPFLLLSRFVQNLTVFFNTGALICVGVLEPQLEPWSFSEHWIPSCISLALECVGFRVLLLVFAASLLFRLQLLPPGPPGVGHRGRPDLW